MSDFNATHNRLVWFDIPVVDLDRAIAFYGAVLAVPVTKEQVGDFSMGVLDHKEGNGGCLVPNAGEIAADRGVLCYLNTEGRIRDAAAQVEAKGGKILEPVHAIGPHGFRVVMVDSEGNRMALHSSADA